MKLMAKAIVFIEACDMDIILTITPATVDDHWQTLLRLSTSCWPTAANMARHRRSIKTGGYSTPTTRVLLANCTTTI